MPFASKAARAENARRYREEHRERLIANSVRWNNGNKERVKERARARWRKRAEFLKQLKAKPCMDCGNTFHHAAMDFDHRPGETKVKSVSLLMASGLIEAALAEIAKCDLICANCHRVRTFMRRRAT